MKIFEVIKEGDAPRTDNKGNLVAREVSKAQSDWDRSKPKPDGRKV